MHHYFNRILTASVLLVSMSAASADVLSSLAAAAETCRQAAIQLDWLSRYQARRDCATNLGNDSLNVYYASKYILANQLPDAQKVLNSAIIQTNFVLDIDCEGQPSIQAVLVSLQGVLQAIS